MQSGGHSIVPSELSQRSLRDEVLHLGHILNYRLTCEYHGALEDFRDTALNAIRSTAITIFSDLTGFITKQALEKVRFGRVGS